MSESTSKKIASIEQIFGTDDLYSPRTIQEWINRIRRANRLAAIEIRDNAEELKGVIARSPGIGMLLGWDSRRKAQRICEPLFEAANANDAAAKLQILAWQRFYQHFGETIDLASGGKGRGKKTIDWGDA
jgi:predicted ATPase